MASGRYPSSRKAANATESRRFDNFFRCSFTSNGKWAYTGFSP